MAKFTAGVAIRLKDITWSTNGVIPAGTTVRIPDEFADDFAANVAPTIPGFAWVSQDESTAIPTVPIAQSDVSNLTTDLASKAAAIHSHAESAITGLTTDLSGKYDKTGGTISGAVTATGAVSGSSLSATGAINGSSMSVSGAATAASHRSKGEPVYNVKAYGAVGDGVTDDTTAIAAAIAAAPSSAGGVIYFPTGSYKVTSALTPSIHLSMRGDGPDSSIIYCAQTSGFGVKYTGVTTAPETSWGRFFAVEKLQIQHAGTSAALAFYYCLNFGVRDVMVKGLGATGSGIEIVDSYVVTLDNVRSHSFPSADGIVLRSTGVTNPGQLLLKNVQSRYNANGLKFDAQSGVIDTCTVDTFIATDNTSTGITLQGSGGNRVLSFRDVHIEQSSSTNTSTGVFQTGTDCLALKFDGMFMWGIQTPFNFSGTVQGINLDRVYMNTNGHATPGTAITASSNVSKFQVGAVINSSVNPYPTLYADSSDSTTRRKVFAGGLPIAQQASTSLPLTTSYQDLTGTTVSITTTQPERWVVIATIDFNVSSADPGLLSAVIVLDGATTGPSINYNAGGVIARSTQSTGHVLTGLSIGSHTLVLQAKKANAGGTASAVAANSRITLIRTGE